jgi:predicted phosphodiesterase
MARVALISDIHGNLPALEAVAADLRAACPDAIYVLGDMINGCPWPAEVLDLIAAAGWPMLLGNHDDAVLQLGAPRMEPRYADHNRYASLWWTRARLNAGHIAALVAAPRELSLTLDGAPLRLLHGIPGNFFIGFLPHAAEGWAVRQLATVTEGTVVGGHTHAAMIRRFGPADTGRSWLVVNCGSAGVPFDGDPAVSYALLDSSADGWRAEIRRVPYDLARLEKGYHSTGLLAAGGPMIELFLRSALTGLPWVADFAWWIREQPDEVIADMRAALGQYDHTHGPGRWAFPYAA